MKRHARVFRVGDCFMTYGQYIVSDAWRWFRAGWIERHGNFYRRCGQPGHELHHVTYRRLGQEDDDDVMMLCRACHWAFH